MTAPKNKYSYKGVIFDLDGVITDTARLHAASWKETFDEYLRLREKRLGEKFRPFSYVDDYLVYVDGKPRYKGAAGFLGSRGIELPLGSPEDSPDDETVCGLGNAKDVKFKEMLVRDGVDYYKGSVDLIKMLSAEGLGLGVASSSKNCLPVLKAAGLEGHFSTIVDGVRSAQMGLKGKPEPDIFMTAARDLGLKPGECIVAEDAVSGVQAGRNGGFGLVVGVARENNETALKENGADIVVTDFAGVTLQVLEGWFVKNKIFKKGAL